MLVELVGGPWCGVAIAVPDAVRWLWIEGDPERLNSPRAYGRPRRGRTLYCREGGRLEHVDHLYDACPDCGALWQRAANGDRVKECRLCQTRLSPK